MFSIQPLGKARIKFLVFTSISLEKVNMKLFSSSSYRKLKEFKL